MKKRQKYYFQQILESLSKQIFGKFSEKILGKIPGKILGKYLNSLKWPNVPADAISEVGRGTQHNRVPETKGGVRMSVRVGWGEDECEDECEGGVRMSVSREMSMRGMMGERMSVRVV